MDHVYASEILYSENLIHLPPPYTDLIPPSFYSFHSHSVWNEGLRGRQRDQVYAYCNLIPLSFFSFHSHFWSKREAEGSGLRFLGSSSSLGMTLE